MKYKIFSQLNYGFIGAGSLCQALIEGFLKGGLKKERIFLSSRTPARLQKIARRFQVQAAADNEELAGKAQVIFLCIKPQDLASASADIVSKLSEEHTIISCLAGTPLRTLYKLLGRSKRIVRAMPNMPVAAGKGLIGCAAPPGEGGDEGLWVFVEELFSLVGLVVRVKEEDLGAFTVAGSSGVGFVLELMQYWSEWLESHQFSKATARKITAQVFEGAGVWAKGSAGMPLMDLQKRVASHKGVTAAGLKAFHSAELDTVLRIGFEKAALREKQLSLTPP